MKPRRSAVLAALSLFLIVVPPAAAASPGDPPGLAIATQRRQLSTAEVRAADITSTAEGARLLADAATGASAINPNARAYRVFSFGMERVVVDAATPIVVFAGLDKNGKGAYEIAALARPSAFAITAGYAAPAESAWKYNNDGSFVHYTQMCGWFGDNCHNVWKRSVFYIIDAVWNLNGYQYFRLIGKMQAQVLTGENAPWTRAALEFDNGGGWGGTTGEFEINLPEEDIHGTDNVTITAGFKAGITIELGKAPIGVGGTIESTYTGSMQLAKEYWHPISRAEVGSGGVQFCRYAGAANMSRKVATRVNIRQPAGAAMGFWYIYDGMDGNADKCPPGFPN